MFPNRFVISSSAAGMVMQLKRVGYAGTEGS